MIRSFLKEECVVIGCSDTHSLCDHSLHHGFFSIDMDKLVSPDHVMNITSDTLPEHFKEKFYLTFTENLDCGAYSILFGKSTDTVENTKNATGWQGLKTIIDLTRPDGFILLSGCPRQFDFRYTIFTKKIKYIEITPDDVLIPMNQNLNINVINEQISQSEILYTVIQNVIKMRETLNPKIFYQSLEEKNKKGNKIFDFCTLDCDSFPTIFEFIQSNISAWNIEKIKINESLENYPAFKEILNVIENFHEYGDKIISVSDHQSDNFEEGRQVIRFYCDIKKMIDYFLSHPDEINDEKIEKLCNSITEKIVNLSNAILPKKADNLMPHSANSSLAEFSFQSFRWLYTQCITGSVAGFFSQPNREHLLNKCIQATEKLRAMPCQ